MDKSWSKTKSAEFLSEHDKEESLRDNILKKFSFLNPIKNYVVSKFRTDKYDFDNSTSNHEISIISYDQHSFNDADKKLDLKPSSDGKVTKEKNNQTKNEDFARINKERLEVLQIVERTFNRQLDIFESLLQVNLDNNKKPKKIFSPKKQVKTAGEDAAGRFINDLINNVVKELQLGPKEKETYFEKNLGDGSQIKQAAIKCECQKINAAGAAISKISSTSDLE